MLQATRAILESVARRALTVLVAAVCLLTPVVPLAARQVADWTGGVTCGMECCKRIGHCCCGRKPAKSQSAAHSSITARECPAGCGASAQPTQSRPDPFRPAVLTTAVKETSATPFRFSRTGRPSGCWLAASLWQRPPPSSSF